MIAAARRHVLAAGVIGALMAAESTLPAAGQGPSVATLPSSANWLAAVRNHRAGAVDEPVVTISRWSREATLGAVQRGLRETSDPALLLRALLLHTDAAIAERAAYEAGLRSGRRTGVLVLDGQSIGGLPRSPHWDIGRQIAAALAARPGGTELVRRWYVATSALLQQWADCGALRPHVEAGMRLLPGDPSMLLYSGTLHQTFADPRVQRFVNDAAYSQRGLGLKELMGDNGDGGGGGLRRDASGRLVESSIGSAPVMGFAGGRGITTFRIGGRSQELGLAERDLRRALELEPARVEARIRLAHVLAEKGEPAEALPLAQAALTSSLTPFLEYYAAMVLGRSLEALGRRPEARRAFERAASVFPAAQSARIALSRYAVADQRAGDAVGAIVAVSGPDAAREAGDPWWWYYRVHEPDSKALLAELRAGAR